MNFTPPTRVDDREKQSWARLNVDLQTEESIWEGASNHSNITRQWAELASWFPALSAAAGSKAMRQGHVQKDVLFPGIRDEDLSQYGGDESGFNLTALIQVKSHGYMVGKNFSDVWSGYAQFTDLLKPAQR